MGSELREASGRLVRVVVARQAGIAGKPGPRAAGLGGSGSGGAARG
jgi:hypothetical protein